MIDQPVLHSANRQRKRNLLKDDQMSAAELLRGVELQGCELFGFTGGQFSLMELLVALLDRVGPAEVDLSTWTAAVADLRDAYNLLECGRIKRFRMLIDRSFETRQPQYCGSVRELFGEDAIRTTRVHAKFAVIRGGGFNLAIRTSMNLNCNRRFEQFEVSDDAALCDFLCGVMDSVWGVGKGFGSTPHDVEMALEAPFSR